MKTNHAIPTHSTQVDPGLWPALSGDSGAEMEAILVSADGLDALLAQLPADITVDHRYRLINSVSVRATAAALRRLVDMPMIKSIESVRPVSACAPTKG